ncbi:hypothetical protein [Methylobacter sp. YRD-M1]|uniref:hypothetical protein n=1 Tax=Methylobacter sp. YRD-M1 TaxID=2911520 RepID=UPI00227C09D1|nr:hypothetical protein [Methylobacter sp. YRD-M1]WAK00592.1 hypothetical protein LZ558_12100 [Methylobacter sp. YRD-M1]
MNKFTFMLAGISMLVIASGASAEPVTLTAAQMDGVNAGALWGSSLLDSFHITVPTHTTTTITHPTPTTFTLTTSPTITLPPFLEVTIPVK